MMISESNKKPTETILVVDDTPENIGMLSTLLKNEYKVKVATSGKKALKIAMGEKKPDLILLDIMMPEMDGYEVCEILKADTTTRDIPIIFVTAKNEVADEARGFDLGAVDFISKPISYPIVKARVKSHLELKAARDKMTSISKQLSRYLSPQIYQTIFDGKMDSTVRTKRKKLSIFFSDICNFTSLSETIAPEDMSLVLNSYLNKMAEVALKHGGTLDKFIGDAVMVFFGDPETRGIKEDALACVRMAKEMISVLPELEKMWVSQGVECPLNVRMGIATGDVTVGNFGSNERMDYTIVGGSVNLASRLESAAQPNQILVSSITGDLIEEEFETQMCDPITAKGFAEPILRTRVILDEKRARLCEAKG